MKDQKRLLNKCLFEDIPAFVVCGTDICAVETMKEYLRIATEKKCNKDFLADMELAIKDFEAFRAQEPEKMKTPD